MTIKLKSAQATAAIKAAVTADVAKAKLQAESPIRETSDIRALWRRYPKAKALFGEIMKVWRQSCATRPGKGGKWAAYTYRDWCRRTGQSLATLKRQLDVLEQHGLIERENGAFDGKPSVSHIRPTAHAIHLSPEAIRPTDWERLGYANEHAALAAVKQEAKGPPPAHPKPKPKPAKPVESYPQSLQELTALAYGPSKIGAAIGSPNGSKTGAV
ncbi:helix-turn-helix domain-containing protein [Sphingomonas sp.]|uniref:helix-turn-helix domain-containing protein n=1 Tax=Sphingomonas sp. TaxID=28214 RepID=UPI002C536BC3|nr:helix-turn-helix domain-containing protein [Sphingomonas sp.]HWK35114.1 helix-turn-helix domain-containing protein [Sphingomonas sp.]